MVHPAAPTPPNDGVSLTEPRRTAPTHLLVLAHATLAHPHPPTRTSWTCASVFPRATRSLPSRPAPESAPDWRAHPDTVTASCSPALSGAISQKQQHSDQRKQLQGGGLIITAEVMKPNINAAEDVQKQIKSRANFSRLSARLGFFTAWMFCSHTESSSAAEKMNFKQVSSLSMLFFKLHQSV